MQTISFFILILGSLYLNTGIFTDSHILPKWLFTLLWIGLIGLFLSIHIVLLKKRTMCKTSVLFNIIICLCLVQAGYGIIQLCGYAGSHSTLYKVTGSFDNPAGFAGCLCAGIPFLFFYSKYPNKRIRWGSYVALFIISTAVFFSESRAGIVSLLIIIYSFFIHPYTKGWKIKTAILSLVLCFTLSYCYSVKKDSANGRLYIWRCTWEMIKDKPFIGHGIGGFNAHYMDYQAAYFKQNPNSKFQILADNIKHPFNEYLKIGTQYGIIGWGVLVLLGVFLAYCYKRSPSFESYICLLSLLSIATFSFFSYPFTYPFIWIITILNISIVIKKEYSNIQFTKNRITNKAIGVCMFAASLFLLYTVTMRIKAEIKWKEISYLSAHRKGGITLSQYKILSSDLGKEPYFLYNYAAELYAEKQYSECLFIANKCRLYWADYSLELMQAETLFKLKQYEQAEVHFNKAKLMCPARFIPLYRLYQIYQIQKKKRTAIQLAEEIVNKTVKVNSITIQLIKAEMKSKLSTCDLQ